MITKINELKTLTTIPQVKTLCESTISAISSAIYNGVTKEAQLDIERVALTNLFEGLEKYTSDKQVNQWLTNQRRIYSLKNLGIRKAVNTLIEKEGKSNFALSNILEAYREHLENDVPEVLLYEGFISALSGYNYLTAVETELSSVAEKVKKYKNDIDITKIIEVMKETRSNYLIPLIEDVVDNYLSDKTQQSKSSLKECLVKFSYDPFVRDILNVLILDATDLQLEYANATCDIEDKLFSPILYLGENEALFNVHGTYYVKKGNNISKIKKSEISKLDEKFVELCNLINLPTVEVSRKDIKFYMGKDAAVINESEVLINGIKFTQDQINENMTAAMWAGNEEFFNSVTALKQNFNEIAELDFVKRVYLKENEDYAADIFKLRDNIFITTFDPLNNKSTFYRNINPIQAEKVMMEHMRFDVSKTFADILPNKDKILAEIDETRKEYSEYIQILENKVEQFSENSNVTSQAVVEALLEELKEIKLDYKNYNNEVEAFVNVSENLNITVQDDGTGKSYTVVVPTGAMAARGSGKGAEGAEGDNYGTEVGMSNMQTPDGASSAVTFDDDQTELLSDEPTIPEDKVDLDADNIEAYADKVDAETELKNPGAENPEGEIPSGEEEFGEPGGTSGETSGEPGIEGGELGAEGGEDNTELDLDLGTGTESPDETETEKNPEAENPEAENPEAENPEKEVKNSQEKEEGVGAPTKNLERTAFDKDNNPNDLDEPKKIKKVFLKRPKKS